MAQITTLSVRIPTFNSATYENISFTRISACNQLFPSVADSTCKYNRVITTTIKTKSFNSPTAAISGTSSLPSTEESIDSSDQPQVENAREKFDWYAQWYPVMPVCDLDKRKPTGKRVIGLDVVVWWDRTESQWKVFNDLCPHRLAPLSEGRIDQWGRLQCVYHGWCFNGSGQCKLIPQAPPDGPPVNTSKKACVAVYPSVVQNGIVWFWPNTDPQFKDILQKKKPPFLPELDDPSYFSSFTNRDLNYGYEALMENLMDPAHLPYAHYGIVKSPPPKIKVDREGGMPLNMSVKHMDINGFSTKREWGAGAFFAPCVYYAFPNPYSSPENGNGSVLKQKRLVFIFICIPVSPGKSRVIWSFPRNFTVWINRIIPRWVFHMTENLVIDSDLYLLHYLERKVLEFGPANWHKVCYLPTKSDAALSGYRRWLIKYSQGQVEWNTRFSGTSLPPTPSREILMDRYWTHVVNCSSCNAAYKGLNIAEMALQVSAFGLLGVVALTKQGTLTIIQRTAIFSIAILFFLASKWLSRFIYKTFHFHDYDHALK
ncbi:protochlorophyllide-dependent translocon component 52, chloroplastic-like [Amaranthus tricolor]|uniref:protochlorophyllide-dependent translocon component 52, chloroplastic-like n=1 Tax=Amaranthus tricolor TaxID=29722 RepID=UPI0025849F73|nr:protochlorophyllide-dependent translocon component 52, chloroplastic-like [Amaranthus tricolor]